MVRIPCRFVVVAVAPVPVVMLPPVRAAWSWAGVGWVIPAWLSCCLASAKEMKTLPKPIFPVGGVIVVVVVMGGAPGVAPGVVVVNAMGVPFLRPVTTAFESAPRKELKSELILSTTLAPP